MSPTNNPPFLLLKLCTCDDLAGATFTLNGPVNALPTLLLELAMPYTQQLAETPFLHKMDIMLPGGYRRKYAVISVTPSEEGNILRFTVLDTPEAMKQTLALLIKDAPMRDRQWQVPAWYQLHKAGLLSGAITPQTRFSEN